MSVNVWDSGDFVFVLVSVVFNSLKQVLHPLQCVEERCSNILLRKFRNVC